MGLLAFGLGVAGDSTVVQMTVPIETQVTLSAASVEAELVAPVTLSADVSSSTTTITCEVEEA
jgi:hypothetical protein